MHKWIKDKHGSSSYDAVGAFEIMLINLGIIKYDNQWDIDDTEKYGIRWSLYSKLRKDFYGEDVEGRFVFTDLKVRGESTNFGKRPGSSKRQDRHD